MYTENHFAKIALNRVEKYADKVLLRIKRNNQWITFTGTQCKDYIESVAKALLAEGVRHQDKVGIFSQNMPEWTLVDIGSTLAGAVPVPIYATNTADQANYLLKDANITILFVGEKEQYEKALELLKDTTSPLKKVIVFDRHVKLQHDSSVYFHDWLQLSANVEDQALEERTSVLSPEDLATLIYTSGTTGNPKGVMLTHANIVHTFKIHDLKFDVSDKDDTLAFLPLSHVFERVWTQYAIYKGMTNTFNTDPKQIGEVLKEVAPKIMCSVPRLYEKIYHMIHNKVHQSSPIKKALFGFSVRAGLAKEHYHSQGLSMPFFTKLRFAIADKLVLSKLRGAMGGNLRFMPCGGAPLSKEITSFFHAIGVPIIVGYGLTETTATVSAFNQKVYTPGTVGVSMPETQIKIGANDEILIKGGNVMKGYYNLPEETAKVFEDGWFKTGDAGKFDEQGNLVITDRIKDLIKTSGGKYVAPQMIEATLTNDNLIEQVVVIGDYRHYITALIVPSFEALHNYAANHNILFGDNKELIENPKIVEFLTNRIEGLQKDLARFEKIKKFTLMPKEFTMESGEMTPTLKIRRKIITKNYQDLIDKMYEE